MEKLIIKETNTRYGEKYINKLIKEWFDGKLECEENKKVIDGLRNGYDVYKYDDFYKQYFNLTKRNIALFDYCMGLLE